MKKASTETLAKVIGKIDPKSVAQSKCNCGCSCWSRKKASASSK